MLLERVLVSSRFLYRHIKDMLPGVQRAHVASDLFTCSFTHSVVTIQVSVFQLWLPYMLGTHVDSSTRGNRDAGIRFGVI